MPPKIWWALAAIACTLAIGSLLRCWMLRRSSAEQRRERLGSLIVWWTMLGGSTLAVLLGPAGVALLAALIGLWALTEYYRLLPDGGPPTPLRWTIYGAVLLNGLAVGMNWSAYTVFLPLVAVLLIPAWYVLQGRTTGFLNEVSHSAWGLLLTAYGLAHAAWFYWLPGREDPQAEGAGWFLYLVVLTQSNDIMQALWGRQFGRHRLAKRVSPHKTWEGWLAGLVSTVVLAVVLGPGLTPWRLWPVQASGDLDFSWSDLGWAVLAGVVIALSGLLGDLTISAIKRDRGLKDSGNMLPGQGGILDRVDSLLFAAPAFLYYLRILQLLE